MQWEANTLKSHLILRHRAVSVMIIGQIERGLGFPRVRTYPKWASMNYIGVYLTISITHI